MTSKKQAQAQARKFRRDHPKDAKRQTVNVVQVSRGNWGIRFSKKGTRSKFDYKRRR